MALKAATIRLIEEGKGKLALKAALRTVAQALKGGPEAYALRAPRPGRAFSPVRAINAAAR